MDTLVLYLYALATCCDSVLVSTRLYCAILCWRSRGVFGFFPSSVGLTPVLVAHTVCCVPVWYSLVYAYGVWKSNSEVLLRNSNFKQTQMINYFTLIGSENFTGFVFAYEKVEGSRLESRANLVKILRIKSFEISC